jgi:hypothetical protein
VDARVGRIALVLAVSFELGVVASGAAINQDDHTDDNRYYEKES